MVHFATTSGEESLSPVHLLSVTEKTDNKCSYRNDKLSSNLKKRFWKQCILKSFVCMHTLNIYYLNHTFKDFWKYVIEGFSLKLKVAMYMSHQQNSLVWICFEKKSIINHQVFNSHQISCLASSYFFNQKLVLIILTSILILYCRIIIWLVNIQTPNHSIRQHVLTLNLACINSSETLQQKTGCKLKFKSHAFICNQS